jgi:hypothetical protein
MVFITDNCVRYCGKYNNSILHFIRDICVANPHEYAPFVVVFIGPAFPFNIYTADLVNRKARRKPLAEQELRNLPEHPISSPVFFNRIRVA